MYKLLGIWMLIREGRPNTPTADDFIFDQKIYFILLYSSVSALVLPFGVSEVEAYRLRYPP